MAVDNDTFKIIDSLILQINGLIGRLIADIMRLKGQIKVDKKIKPKPKESIKDGERLLEGFENTLESLRETKSYLESLKLRYESFGFYYMGISKRKE